MAEGRRAPVPPPARPGGTPGSGSRARVPHASQKGGGSHRQLPGSGETPDPSWEGWDAGSGVLAWNPCGDGDGPRAPAVCV